MRDWFKSALCSQTDPTIFYPPSGSNGAAAKRVCANCPVAQECLDEALDNLEEFGVWGGTNPADRLRMLREIHGKEFNWPESVAAMMTPNRVGWEKAVVCIHGHSLLVPGAVKVLSDGTRRCQACLKDAHERQNAKRRAERAERAAG